VKDSAVSSKESQKFDNFKKHIQNYKQETMII